jgi:integrase
MARGHVSSHGGGKWRVVVSAGSDPVTGKRRQLSKVVSGTRDDAERALTALLAEVDAGTRGTDGRTFGDVLDIFLDHKTLSVEDSTSATWRHSASYVPDRLRALPLGRVDVEVLEALYAHLARKGNKRSGGPLSVSTVRNVHVVIYGALELARRRKWISVNPAVDAEVPAAPRRLPSPAPTDAIPLILAAAAGEHHALPTYLQVTICAGGRRGEVHGLRWSGVDFTKGLVVLRDTIVHGSGGWKIKPYTKTGGQRTIHVDEHTLARLQALHDRAFTDALTCEVVLPTTGFVFSDSVTGERPWNPNTTAARFKRCCAKAGLPATTRLHDLRHLMATYLLDQGVPLPVVSARLGHDRNSTTLDIYTGRVTASDAGAATVMGHLFDGPAGDGG